MKLTIEFMLKDLKMSYNFLNTSKILKLEYLKKQKSF